MLCLCIGIGLVWADTKLQISASEIKKVDRCIANKNHQDKVKQITVQMCTQTPGGFGTPMRDQYLL